MAKQKTRTLYKVRGRWPFPTDMLRYDDSEPATPEDAALIAQLETENGPEDVVEFRRYHDVTLHLKTRWGPTEDRWKSFLWYVSREPYKEVL